MKSQHYFNVLKTDSEGNFPAEQFATLPEFCKLRFKETATSVVTYIDGWEIVPSGDALADFETGRKYAEMTVAYARKIRSPTFISFVLEAISLKQYMDGVSGVTGAASYAIESGFFQRLAQITFCGALN